MSAISSIVKRRVSSTFCTEPADTATPHIAGAMAGSGTSKITIAPGPLLALPYIATSFPPAAASNCSTAARRSVLGFSRIAFRACGVYSAVIQNSIGVTLPWLSCSIATLGGVLPKRKWTFAKRSTPISRTKPNFFCAESVCGGHSGQCAWTAQRVKRILNPYWRRTRSLCDGISEIDIWQAPQVMLKLLRRLRRSREATRAETLLAAGDGDGTATWRRIHHRRSPSSRAHPPIGPFGLSGALYSAL